MIAAVLDEHGYVIERRGPNDGGINAVEAPDYIQHGDRLFDGIWMRDGIAIEAPPITWTALEFLSKFTDAQKIMLYRAAATDEGLALLMMHLFTAQEVISDNPMTLGARAALLPVLGEAETVRIFDQQ